MNLRIASFALLAAAAVAACHSDTTAPMAARGGLQQVSSGPVLVECPTDVTTSTSAIITPSGGSISVDGSSIEVPAGAVVVPTKITFTVPASRFMEVDITADGAANYEFEVPVTVSVSYARCSRSNIGKDSLSVWYIDSQTKALLNNMGGSDNKTNKKVTFITDHLSGYAVAN